MRCPDCNKFVSQDQQEPEANLDITGATFDEADNKTTIDIGGDVRLVLTCADCGTELKEANPEVEIEVEIEGDHTGEGHELSLDVDADSCDRTEGKGRGLRTFYGAEFNGSVRCKCGAEVEIEASVDEQASAFEEMV